MKHLRIVFLLSALLVSGTGFAQGSPNPKMQIAREGTPEQKAALEQELLKKGTSYSSEEDYQNAQNLLYSLGNEEAVDSLTKVILKKFPKGQTARSAFISDVYYKEEDLQKKEKLYRKMLKKWPVKKFPGDEVAYDYLTASLASGYADTGNYEKANLYLGELRERFWRGNAYLSVAEKMMAKGDTAAAVPLLKLVEDDGRYYINLPENEKDNKALFAAMGYSGAVSKLVHILSSKGQHEEALQKVEEALELAPDQAGNFASAYAVSLEATGRKLEALNQLAKIYETGQFGVAERMKPLYTDMNTTDKGFEAYLEDLQSDIVAEIREKIKTNERFEPAPDFELLNLEGEKVSLASLKGKVLVLDFWATWCQPCIRSFPGMQAAQEMYADDDEVEFLFINTWERSEDYKEQVTEFIEKNQYPFNVLFDDEIDPETKQNLAARFGVQGIPAKFIIDGEGNIRYALMGSSPFADYIKLEMRELIEEAKKPKEEASEAKSI